MNVNEKLLGIQVHQRTASFRTPFWGPENATFDFRPERGPNAVQMWFNSGNTNQILYMVVFTDDDIPAMFNCIEIIDFVLLQTIIHSENQYKIHAVHLIQLIPRSL
jgi:hypothetical protein